MKTSGLETADDKSLKAALETANRLCFVHEEEIREIAKPGSLFILRYGLLLNPVV